MVLKIFIRLVIYSVLLSGFAGLTQAEPPVYGIGFLEGGPYPAHAEFRNVFRAQLEAMVPAGIQINYPINGFKSAGWNRDTSKVFARELTADKTVDMVVALGPWSVEDLLAAGFNRPIVAVLRFDPVSEGLINAKGRPIVDNLTVRIRPHKLESDFQYLAELVKPDTIGVLYFPSDGETNRALETMRTVGRQLGFEIVTAEGYDTHGAYAFFKAYRQLSRRIKALYLPPLWGCDGEKIRQFYEMVARDRIPAFVSEGEYHVSRGAFAGGSAESALTEAHFQAWKAIRIIQGAVPADLPYVLADTRGLTVNEQVAREVGVTVTTDRRYELNIIEAPAPDGVERLTVIDALSIALTQNPGMDAAYAAMKAAEEAASEAWSAYLPQIELSGAAAHYDDNTVNNHPRYDDSRYRARLSLRQELFSLGAIRDIRTASLESNRSGTDQKRVALDLELAVTLAYLDLVRAEQMWQVEQTHRRQTQDCLQMARLRYELKEGYAAEVWRAEEEWVASLQQSRRVDCERKVARILLNTLLGRPGDYSFVPDWGAFSDSRFLVEQSVLEKVTRDEESRQKLFSLLLDLAAANNPEIAGSDLQVAIQKSRLNRANASFFPQIGFFANLDATRELAARQDFHEASPSWSIGAEIRLPLFLGGRTFHERSRMKSLLDQRVSQNDQVSLEAAARLRQALEQALSRVEEYPMAARAAELADQTLPEMLTRYSSGLSTLLELADALRNDTATGRNAIETRIEYYRAVSELVRAMGISAYESGHTASEELLSKILAQ